MDQRQSKAVFPKSAAELYVKMYCKRRNLSKNKMIEAVRSWTTLSRSEKDHFINKYKECRHNYNVKLANYIKRSQPYMKRKNLKWPDPTYDKGNQQTLENNEALESSQLSLDSQSLNNHSFHIEEQSNFGDDTRVHSGSHVSPLPNVMPINQSIRESGQSILAEPTPPSIRTGRELFQSITGNTNETWKELSCTQKKRYQQAVTHLKNDYIKQYKEYLESLSSKKLFEYYTNFSFD